jgi:succinyl-CoA synthetase alpha subunit
VSAINRIAVRRKFYLDSVALMRSSKSLAALPGVIEAAMMMGTAANIEIMQNAGLLDEGQVSDEFITAADLIIGVRANDESAVEAALASANDLLDAPTASADALQWRPRSIRSAVAAKPNANFVLISVPGEFAISEARKAVRRGLHTMIFSDNVPLEQEAQLKEEAAALGKLVMGPDCGTAIINGIPLAFANKVPRGPVGIVGASGTGMQEVSCLLAQHGVGISQAVGVGGRDLKEAVGGIMSCMALQLLIDDKQTQHIVLIAKPAAPEIVAKVLALLATTDKSATLCFLGAQSPEALPANCKWSTTLQDAAFSAMSRVGVDASAATDVSSLKIENSAQGKLVRGLFCGGTLCAEAQVLFAQAGVLATSNVPLDDTIKLDHHSHTLIDLGDDEYTRGKPHPMIDPSSRDAPVQQALEDDSVGVLLVDMVIGYGAHADPAGYFVDCLQRCKANSTLVIASVTGTEDDPQGLSAQRNKLSAAGVTLAASNADAVAMVLNAIGTSQ